MHVYCRLCWVVFVVVVVVVVSGGCCVLEGGSVSWNQYGSLSIIVDVELVRGEAEINVSGNEPTDENDLAFTVSVFEHASHAYFVYVFNYVF